MTEQVAEKPDRSIAPPWWLWVGGMNGLFLGAAFAVKAGWTGNKYVRKLAPNWEYTVGNWWSGMLLLAFAGLAANAAGDSRHGPKCRGALRVLSWLGLGLCLDELGSLHERAVDLLPLPGYWNLAPFALLFVLAMGWALRVLWQTGRGFRRACPRMLLGFVFLGSAEPYDMIEHAIEAPGWYAPVSVVIEEGLELLGGTLLIGAALGLRSIPPECLSTQAAPGGHPVLSRGLLTTGHIVLASALPLLILRHLLQRSDVLDLHTRGDFGATPAVMLFALAGAALVIRTRHRPERFPPLTLILAAAAILVSIELGCNIVSWVARESVRTPIDAWWAQLAAATAGYALLRFAARPITPARGLSPGAAA